MADQFIDPASEKEPIDFSYYEIVAENVSEDDYLEYYADQHCEWLEGTVVKMSPVHDFHDKLTRYLTRLFETYLELRPIGDIRIDPFVMRLSSLKRHFQPDIQVILKDNPHKLTPTFMDGPADICVEIVSPGSAHHDRGVKFTSYEEAGVPEYWLIDPVHTEARFYRVNDDGIYQSVDPDAQGHYQTPRLPDLLLHVPTLWHKDLPGPIAVVNAVTEMLKD